MANQSGFQSNTTIHAAFWWYKPDRQLDPTGREIFIEINGVQKIEVSADHNKVWLFYAQNNVSTSQEPYILEGNVAQAFVADMEGLFS
jgi:hypothetical protein